jgi:hypothetical protein
VRDLRHAFRLLFIFASKRLGIRPSQICLEQIDAALILDFLAHIEQQRGNCAATRNGAGSSPGSSKAPSCASTGPYVVCGAWWRTEVQREYAFAKAKRGECLWLYYDRQRRRWFIQGAVE